MTARVLDRRSVAAHRLRIERARMTAELWQLVRLGQPSATASQDAPVPRQSARRAKSLLDGIIDSAATLGRSAATRERGSKSKRSKSKRSSAVGESTGSAAKQCAAKQSARVLGPPAQQVPATSVPAPRDFLLAARLESADGRVVRGATDRTELVDVMEIATGLASVLRG